MKNTAGMSQQAIDFIKAYENADTLAPDRGNIEAYRKYASDEFRPRAKRALEQNDVEIRECTIGGIPCLEILTKNSAPIGTLLYGFGGGFVCGSSYEDLIVTAPVCAMTDMRIICPNYRLAPEHPWPAAIDDGFAVYKELVKQGPFSIMGESAGGNFALALCHRAKTLGLPLPKAMVLLSPWCDLEQAGESLTANDGRDPTLTYDINNTAVELYAGSNDCGNPDISPLNGGFDASYPPTMITTGSRDLLLSHCLRLSRVMRNAGIATRLDVWEGMWHVFEFYDELPEARESLLEISGFLKAHG